MKCEITRDLLPLYADGLCSEETNAQVQAHLRECPECREKLANYQASIGEESTESQSDAVIAPMKKVRRKMRRNKWLSIVLGIVLTILVGSVGVLTIGEMRGDILSFSTIADVIRLNHITDELTKGNTQELLDAMAFRWEDVYAAEKLANMEDLTEYKAHLKKQMDAAYAHYFEGRNITVEFSEVYSTEEFVEAGKMPTAIKGSTVYSYAFHDGDEWILTMEFTCVDGYYFISEYGGENYNDDVYSFTETALPPDEVVMELFRYKTKQRYEAFAATGEIPESTPLKMCFKYSSDVNADADALHDRMTALYEEGWALKGYMYSLDSFDTEKGRWLSKVWFTFENPETGERCIMERRFLYYGSAFYITEDEPAVIIGKTGDIPATIEEMILQVF